VLDQMSIGPEARLPGGTDPVHLGIFCKDLVKRLLALAMEQARHR
jgi:hypothetical protein